MGWAHRTPAQAHRTLRDSHYPPDPTFAAGPQLGNTCGVVTFPPFSGCNRPQPYDGGRHRSKMLGGYPPGAQEMRTSLGEVGPAANAAQQADLSEESLHPLEC